MAIEFHKLKVADIRRETPEAVSIAFAVPPELKDDYRFSPGQHLTLRQECDGQDIRRSYSICAGLDDGELRVAVKKVEGGIFSTLCNDAIKPGDLIEVMTPQGP
jgi:ring-1,2-phenylacetyl-CoA epoxidase subunit PaaE